MMPDKKRPKTDSPAANKRVKGEKKEEVVVIEIWLSFSFSCCGYSHCRNSNAQAGDQKDNFNYDPVHFIRFTPSLRIVASLVICS